MKTRQKRREKVPLPKCGHLHFQTDLLFRKGGINFVAKAIFHTFVGGFGHEKPAQKGVKKYLCQNVATSISKLICCLEREASTLWQRLYFTPFLADLVIKTRQKRREKVPLPKCDHLHFQTYLLFRNGGVNFVANAIFHAFFGGFGHENPPKTGVKKYLCQNVTTSISKLICCLEREASKVAQAIFHAFFGGLVQLGGQDISNFKFIYLQPLRGIATRLKLANWEVKNTLNGNIIWVGEE